MIDGVEVFVRRPSLHGGDEIDSTDPDHRMSGAPT